MPSCIIIGAGMTGLTAARNLQQNGWTVTVLDKGRGVGGRMATRRLADARADHGAQYFTARTAEFQQFISELMDAGVVREWALQETKMSDISFHHPRFIGTEGMSGIAKYMAQPLNVRTGERAVHISGDENGCTVVTESGQIYQADKLILTIPAPQASALLEDSRLLSASEQAVFDAIEYAPCLAVMVLLNGSSDIPPPGIVKFDQGPVAWVADNFQKGISTNTSITIHASAAYSKEHLENDLNVAGQQLIDLLGEWIPKAQVDSFQVHRWRYSLAEKCYPNPYFVCTTPFTLLMGGDGFGQGNVEGAFQSGLQMARVLLDK